MNKRTILSETPLPPDWDSSVFDNKPSFKKMVTYAMERSKRIGSGSSRIAFIIDYKGRETVLKVAKNKKGLGQNEEEVKMLDDWVVQDLDIVIPMIDHDLENRIPRWVHLEKAKKMNRSSFTKFFDGYTPDVVMNYVKMNKGIGEIFSNKKENEMAKEILDNNEYAQRVIDLVVSFDLPTAEFSGYDNWGVYKNKPVIIDIGFNLNVFQKYYSLS